jgi:hypothetical protein
LTGPTSGPRPARPKSADPLLFTAGLVAASGLRLYRRLGDQADFAPIEAPRIFKDGAIAQLGERFNGIEEVVGSIPSGSTIVKWLKLFTVIAREKISK